MSASALNSASAFVCVCCDYEISFSIEVSGLNISKGEGAIIFFSQKAGQVKWPALAQLLPGGFLKALVKVFLCRLLTSCCEGDEGL